MQQEPENIEKNQINKSPKFRKEFQIQKMRSFNRIPKIHLIKILSLKNYQIEVKEIQLLKQ